MSNWADSPGLPDAGTSNGDIITVAATAVGTAVLFSIAWPAGLLLGGLAGAGIVSLHNSVSSGGGGGGGGFFDQFGQILLSLTNDFGILGLIAISLLFAMILIYVGLKLF